MSLTHSDRLVLIMNEFEGEFDEWSLTVKAWEMFPEFYGLRGFENLYPDHKSVCNIYQKPGGPVGQGYMEKIRPNYYRILPAGEIKAQQLSATGSESGAIAKLETKMIERLWRAKKSRAHQTFLQEGKIPNDWNAASGFFEVSIPVDQMGSSGSKKFGDTGRNTNQGAIIGLRDILIHAIQLQQDLIAATASGGGRRGTVSRSELIELATTFNELIQRWAKALESIGVNAISDMIIEVGE